MSRIAATYRCDRCRLERSGVATGSGNVFEPRGWLSVLLPRAESYPRSGRYWTFCEVCVELIDSYSMARALPVIQPSPAPSASWWRRVIGWICGVRL